MLALDDVHLLTEAVVAAGDLALRMRARGVKTVLKADSSPVTDADLAVNDLLHDRLRQARPGYGWLSEETPDSGDRLQRNQVFIVDPIDGTRAFVDGEAGFAHAVAVATEGQITAAVVHLPARGQTYAAALDGPATLNGEPIRLRSPLQQPEIMAGRAALSPAHWPGGLVPHDRKWRYAMQIRLCLLAEGQADAVIAMDPVAEWDSGAGAFIAMRAGAVATDRDGQVLRFNQPDVRGPGLIVAAPSLHQTLLRGRAGT